MFKTRKARISYSELVGSSKEERISCFLPCLHLDSQQRVFLEQEKHFDEIWVWLYHHYMKHEAAKLGDGELVKEAKEEIEAGVDNPLSGFSDYDSLGLENEENL
jgi:chromatin segregation and condensation protein Rec8/ScpA/Scc1 (kleisin family)